MFNLYIYIIIYLIYDDIMYSFNYIQKILSIIYGRCYLFYDIIIYIYDQIIYYVWIIVKRNVLPQPVQKPEVTRKCQFHSY